MPAARRRAGRARARLTPRARQIAWRLSDEPPGPADAGLPPAARRATRAKIFLGFTSNLASAGVREHVRFLVQHRMVDVVVTTAGGVEEDLIKARPWCPLMFPWAQGTWS